MATLTQKRLKELLSYDPETGIFTWATRTSHRVSIGDIAGSKTPYGYFTIGVDGHRYQAHCLAFLFMEGYLPEYDTDHINGIRDDNRWCNLRHVSRACNMQNSKVRHNNTSGYTGVCYCKSTKKWRALIRVNGRSFCLGRHNTPLDAALARITAEDCHPDYHCDVRCENREKVFTDLNAPR